MLSIAPSSYLIISILVAMMAPLLSEPIRQLWARSFPRRRLIAISFFVIAYTTTWMLAGIILLIAAKQLQAISKNDWLTAPGIALLVLIIWQASPWKQICLNYCHWQPRLSPFGIAAHWDCFRFGLIKGFWCIGSCWAFMFLPLVFVNAGLPLMLLTSLILVAERCHTARPARWQVPLFGRI